ncbi:MAG: FtsX-like permease family protein [Longimicrobiales bacterium]
MLPALPSSSVSLLVRGAGAASVLASVRGLARDVDSRIVVAEVNTGRAMVGLLLTPQRLGGVVAALFALLSVALCLTGVWGVVAYSVSARRSEFGVRLTLGAEPSRITGEVVRRTGSTALVGALLGGAGSLVLTRVAAAYLYGVGAGDVLPAALAALAVLALALLATWMPARRAGQVDPAAVLGAS